MARQQRFPTRAAAHRAVVQLDVVCDTLSIDGAPSNDEWKAWPCRPVFHHLIKQLSILLFTSKRPLSQSLPRRVPEGHVGAARTGLAATRPGRRSIRRVQVGNWARFILCASPGTDDSAHRTAPERTPVRLLPVVPAAAKRVRCVECRSVECPFGMPHCIISNCQLAIGGQPHVEQASRPSP